jgi:hypothetical protein
MLPDFSHLALFAARWAEVWYLLPLVIIVSLVYSGTRHEEPSEILTGSARTAVWVCGFMAIIFVVLWLMGLGI